MSDDESFVILGTSPMQSLEQDGINGKQSQLSSLQSDTPGSRFSSLKKSQVTELQNASEPLRQSPAPNAVMGKSSESKCYSPQVETSTVMKQSAIDVWSTPQGKVEGNLLHVSLKDSELKSHLQQSLNGVEKEPSEEYLKNVIITAPSSLNTPQHSINTNGISPSSGKATVASTLTNQVTELQGARESFTQTPPHSDIMEQSAESKLWSRPQVETSTIMEQSATASNLWSIPQVEVGDNLMPVILEDCALKSPLKQSLNRVEKEPTNESLKNVIIAPSSLNTPQNSSNTNGQNPSSSKTTAVSTLTNQVTKLQVARESSTQTPPQPGVVEKSAESKLWSRPQMETPTVMEESATASNSWSIPHVEVEDILMPVSLEDCALKSTLKQSLNTLEKVPAKESQKNVNISASNLNTLQNSLNTNGSKPSSSKTIAASTSANTNLASSFIMGDVNADVLKTSVYSQFPSISMEACAEDVVKLQNMVIEYMQLKNTLDKVNNTMKLFYTNSMQWKEKMNQMENQYKEQLNECQTQIKMLHKENHELKQSFEAQVEQTKALDVARQKDREDTIKEISEKNAIIENMRAQIVKLEKQQLATFEFIPKKSTEKTIENFDDLYVTRGEHELIVNDLRRELSELLASNLDFKDVEKQYVDELNCLKVNLTSAEEIIKQNRADIAELRALDLDKQKKIEYLETLNNELRIANSEQNERIIVLEQQNEVHRNDFEMERQSRETAVGEKHQILQDLRALQRKNQDLIEERQKIVQTYEKRMSSASSGGANSSFIAAAAAAQTYVDNPQRPIRDLTPPSPNSQTLSPPASLYRCPVCNKGFKSLNVLQSHVNDCIDRN